MTDVFSHQPKKAG